MPYHLQEDDVAASEEHLWILPVLQGYILVFGASTLAMTYGKVARERLREDDQRESSEWKRLRISSRDRNKIILALSCLTVVSTSAAVIYGVISVRDVIVTPAVRRKVRQNLHWLSCEQQIRPER